jgi:hypothetical protein
VICVICDESDKNQVEAGLRDSVSQEEDYVYVTSFSDLEDQFAAENFVPSTILITVSLAWPAVFYRYQHFGGVKIGAALRRDYLQRAPIIFLAVTGKQYLLRLSVDEKFLSFLDSEGAGFVSFPWSVDKIATETSGLKALSERQLDLVVAEHCDLVGHWRSLAHRLGNCVNELSNRRSEARSLVKLWGRSITRFAPQHVEAFTRLRDLFDQDLSEINHSELKDVLQSFDTQIRGLGDQRVLSNAPAAISDQVPNSPPTGYSKLLVADDMPQDFLMNSLEAEYGYQIIRPQAMKLPTAKSVFDRELPGVVLADMYYKRSDRDTEVPDKRVGDEFIRYVLTHPAFRDSAVRKPIVLVISKAELNPETEVRFGAINCSGVKKATDPAFIHRSIWAAARERGVVELDNRSTARTISNRDINIATGELARDLERCCQQWESLGSVIFNTIESGRRLRVSRDQAVKSATAGFLVHLHELSQKRDNLSIQNCIGLLEQTEELQRVIAAAEPTELHGEWKDLLHGGIAQFGMLPRSSELAVSKVKSILSNLKGTVFHQEDKKAATFAASRLRLIHTLSFQFNTKVPARPTLIALDELLKSILRTASQTEESNGDVVGVIEDAGRREVIRVIIVEDNPHWASEAQDAINQAHRLLGANYQFDILRFQDADSAIESITAAETASKFRLGNAKAKRTFAIVDLCIPQSAQANPKSKGSGRKNIPRVEHGMNVVRTLTSYKYNIPLVVFSSTNDSEDANQLREFGIWKESVIRKDDKSGPLLSRKLVHFVERSTKHVLGRFESESGTPHFRINTVDIPLSSEISETFSAIYQHCQINRTRDFEIDDIIERRTYPKGSDPVSIFHDHIYRIRIGIHRAFRNKGEYIDTKHLIELRGRGEKTKYKLNAEVMTVDEEEELRDYLANEDDTVPLVLLVGQQDRHVHNILKAVGYQISSAKSIIEARSALAEQEIAVVWLFPSASEIGLDEQSSSLSLEARSKQIPLLTITSENADKLYPSDPAANKWARYKICLDINHPYWIHSALAFSKQAIELKMFDPATLFIEPIVELLTGTDLIRGILRLSVNGNNFRMNRSVQSKILGLLLLHPGKTINWLRIKRQLGIDRRHIGNDRKNWTRRLRDSIQKRWAPFEPAASRSWASRVLSSSKEGLCMNATVVRFNFKSTREGK